MEYFLNIGIGMYLHFYSKKGIECTINKDTIAMEKKWNIPAISWNLE